jgi:hypothetical protein
MHGVEARRKIPPTTYAERGSPELVYVGLQLTRAASIARALEAGESFRRRSGAKTGTLLNRAALRRRRVRRGIFVAVLGGASCRLGNRTDLYGCSLTISWLQRLNERHLLLLAVEPDGRKTWRRSRAKAVAKGGSPSPGQGGRLSGVKGCYKRQATLNSR